MMDLEHIAREIEAGPKPTPEELCTSHPASDRLSCSFLVHDDDEPDAEEPVAAK